MALPSGWRTLGPGPARAAGKPAAFGIAAWVGGTKAAKARLQAAEAEDDAEA